MKVQLDDHAWAWDPDDITVDEALEIKKATGLSWAPFLGGVFELDPVAVRGLIWFLRKRDGEAGLLLEGVKFRIGDLRILTSPAESEEEEADPPQARRAVRSRAPRTTTTSKAS